MTTENPEALLTQWRAVDPQQMPCGRIKLDAMFQPRNARLTPFRDRGRLEEQGRAHVEDLAGKLEGGSQLEPVLVARIDGKLYLIDGHHRMQAYRRDGRDTIPARIRDSTRQEALIASKAANCDGVKLPMHAEQQREAAWQYLAIVTRQGRRELPEGLSTRSIARLFGTKKDTVWRMQRRLATVDPAGWSAAALDPGTGWPQWIHVKGNAIRDRFADAPEDVREQHRDERRAAMLAKMIDRDGLEPFLRSLRLLADEAVAAEANRLAEAMAGEDGDY